MPHCKTDEYGVVKDYHKYPYYKTVVLTPSGPVVKNFECSGKLIPVVLISRKKKGQFGTNRKTVWRCEKFCRGF
jgi:hypothetical protein